MGILGSFTLAYRTRVKQANQPFAIKLLQSGNSPLPCVTQSHQIQ